MTEKILLLWLISWEVDSFQSTGWSHSCYGAIGQFEGPRYLNTPASLTSPVIHEKVVIVRRLYYHVFCFRDVNIFFILENKLQFSNEILKHPEDKLWR